MKLKYKINIAIFSTTRAEYGLLKPLIEKTQNDKKFNTFFFVGGSHLSKGYGYTINEIIENNINITQTFKYPTKLDTNFYISNSMSKAIKLINFIFKKYEFDIVIVLGDRYELIPIILNSILYKKIIAHIGGGETTTGLIDEQIRGMISKASHLHFTTSKNSSQKLISMGENKKRIFNTGSLSIDYIKQITKIKKNKIIKQYGLDNNLPIVLFTYHPVTLEFKTSVSEQIENCFEAINYFKFNLIITSPNLEIESKIIKKIILKYVKKNKNYKFFYSLGFNKYHQILQNTDLVIGNSSSGIIEAPYYKIPTINIGIRQKNRQRHISIIDVNYSISSIKMGIKKAFSNSFRKKIKNMSYFFGNGKASENIIKVLYKYKSFKNLIYK